MTSSIVPHDYRLVDLLESWTRRALERVKPEGSMHSIAYHHEEALCVKVYRQRTYAPKIKALDRSHWLLAIDIEEQRRYAMLDDTSQSQTHSHK
jgi:hypothetical protein